MLPAFLQFLSEQKSLSPAAALKISKILEEGNRSLDQLLLQEGELEEEALLEKKADFYHLPAVDLSQRAIPRSVLDLFPREVIINYQMAPFEGDQANVHVAMVNPGNLKAREAVDFIARQKGWNTQFYVATASGLKHVLDQYANLSSEVKEALSLAGTPSSKLKEKEEKERKIDDVIKSAPISKMVNVIVRHAVEGGASDIHIEPGEKDSRVRYRIDGELHTTLSIPKYIHASIVSRIKVLANLKIDETRRPQDGRIHMNIGDRAVDFRVSTMPLLGMEKVVMRILDVTKGAPTLEELGFLGRNLEIMLRQIKQPNGLILVTGPTGSGKSTTLFSALTLVNREGVNIVTLEDPIEYYLAGVNQSQVNSEVGYTFATGLRSILRQDPDVIMVGEIRDNETAQLAVQSALTGHLVLATLHTNDAAGAIPRLIDMKVEPFLLTHTINAIGAQRLIRKICQECKEEIKIPPAVLESVNKVMSAIPAKSLYPGVDKNAVALYKGQGCPKCAGTGFSGRLGVIEMIENTKAMQRVIAKGFNQDEARAELDSQNFISMQQDGTMKALLGLTTIEEVLLATRE